MPQSAHALKRAGQRANGQRLTRKRIPLSCEACRTRKLKCNREKPCQNCVARGEGNAPTCTYAEKADKKAGQANPRSDAEDMRKRLNRLESSLLSMISKDGEPASDSKTSHQRPGDRDIGSETLVQAGGTKISENSTSTHWDVILKELGAMKDAWSEENDKIEFSEGLAPPSKAHRPGLLSGLTKPPDRATIIASLPPRDASDKLVLRFFDSYNPAIPARYVLHKSTFLAQYNRHWLDPTKSKTIWIGLLFSIYCIALQSYIRTNTVPPEYEGTAPATAELYRVKTAQCLIIADLTKPVDFMIETINLHSFAEYAEEADGDMGTWILSGMMMRIALQQGYHRDPSNHPNVSVFQGEMRRRMWSAVNQYELLFSVQIGLPRAIRYAECDTKAPRNLHETELYEDMTELPQARPLTEDTEICYQVLKCSMLISYGYIIEFVHILEPQPYQEALKLDTLLTETYETIPPHLQLRTIEEMQGDDPARVMERYILQLFYHKGICILHRKYWNAIPEDATKSRFYSRQKCVASSLALLEHQYTMHKSSSGDGCLGNLKWYHFSITNHDFLLAAMILSLDYISICQSGSGLDVPECVIPAVDKLSAIRRSRGIWADVVDDCRDAKRAVAILTGVLNKVSATTKEAKREDSTRLALNIGEPPAYQGLTTSKYSTFFTDQNVLEPLLPVTKDYSAEDYSPYDTIMQDDFLNHLGSDITMPSDFNWDVWDQFVAAQPQPQPLNVTDYFQQQTVRDLQRLDPQYPFTGYMNRSSMS